MRIRHVSIHNFQSLVAVDLDLAPFTVIVGPSSSGKSALIRAFKALCSNIRGSAFITRGAKSAAISVRTSTHLVTLERTETTATYRVIDPAGAEQTYTKLSGGVPEDVSRILGISPGASLNFSGQFDAPFLLRESGASVARILGELTNVDRIFEAVREANRRRSAHAGTLRTREADLAAVHTRMAAFAGLPERMRRLDEAEQVADTVTGLAGRVARLRAAVDSLDVTEAVLARTRALPPAPSTAAVDAAQERLTAFTALTGEWLTNSRLAGTWADEAAQHATSVEREENELRQLLEREGVCPTCGATIG